MRHDLNALAVFRAVMEERNVTAAAERLGLAQSTVSAALDRLRHTLKDDLYTRTRYGVVPTERALAIAPQIASALDALDDVFVNPGEFQPDQETRTFRIVASAYFEAVVLPEIFVRISESAPGIRLEVESLGAIADTRALAARETDLALGRFSGAEEQFVVRQVMEDRFVCLAPRDGYPGQSTLTREQYETALHVVVSPPGRWRTGVFQTLDAEGLRRTVRLTVSHFAVLPIVLPRVGGLATVPHRIGLLAERQGTLRCIEPPTDLGSFPMHMLWHPRYRSDASHRWLRGIVQTACRTVGA